MAISDLFKKILYKIFFVIGVSDIGGLLATGVWSGFLATDGSIFCINPTTVFLQGLFSTWFWVFNDLACIFLIFNRCVDLLNQNVSKKLFSNFGSFMFSIPILFFLFFGLLYPFPLVFSSYIYSQNSDAFIGTTSIRRLPSESRNPSMFYFLVTLLFSTSFLILNLTIFFAYCSSDSKPKKSQSKLILQTYLIVVFKLMTTISILFLPDKNWTSLFYIGLHLARIASHGSFSSYLIYIAMILFFTFQASLVSYSSS